MEKARSNLSFFETEGFSMWPFVMRQERLIVKKSDFDDLRRGDIILYCAEGNIVCHRLVKKVKAAGAFQLYCRGDASWSGGEYVSLGMVQGRVIGIVKDGRNIWIDGFLWRIANCAIVWIAPVVAYSVDIIMRFRKK